ncbi:hypothetical protein DIPPA_17286 [Diplonema papillatum]|nr:hypothetical protein DIPPA_17286 [Diplonema papillatum]
MAQLSTLLAVALLGVAAAAQEESASKKPEAEWLTMGLLHKWAQDLGYTSTESPELRAVELKLAATGNLVFAEFSDNNSLKLATSWDSSQEKLGDGPLTNGWNNERRFCKMSIADKPDGGTLLVMHFDQLLPVSAGQDAVFSIVKKSIELFETGVVEFDMFSKDTYRQWTQQASQQASEEED